MTDKYLLDTNIIIDLFKGENKTVEIINKIGNEKIFLSAVAISEYYVGVYRSNNPQEQITTFENFIKKGEIIILDIDSKIAKKFGELQANNKRKGELKPVLDLFIASTCLVNNLILVTKNIKDFKDIEGLKIYRQ